MPLQETSGNLTTDAFGGGVAVVPNYIEDVFSTYLYTGVSQPGNSSVYGYLVNNIDLLTKGGMIWTKDRSTNASGTNDNVIVDTLRGTGTWPAGISNSPYMLKTNTTAAQVTMNDAIQGVTTTGYYIGPGNTGVDAINTLNNNYASWTFRKQPKFFDVVTYTGNDGYYRAINHNLGSVPGCIMVKNITNSSDWWVYHRGTDASSPADYNLILNSTSAKVAPSVWGGADPTSTQFTVNPTTYPINSSGSTYVAYLFAHNAGGFGLTGTDNVISCGSVVGASQVEVTLGYEPQWILVKNTSAAQDWWLVDNMRGLPVQATDTSYNASNLRPNTSGAETTGFSIAPSATGFKANVLTSGQTYIYIAIRRGPMKVPTNATKVFTPATRTGTSAAEAVTSAGFPIDLIFSGDSSQPRGFGWDDRLNGAKQTLSSSSTSAYSADAQGITGFDSMTGMSLGDGTSFSGNYNVSGENYVYQMFRRAPSFFDEVCYTGTGTATLALTHNLGVVPTMMIVKSRSNTSHWMVYVASEGNTKELQLERTNAVATNTNTWGSTTPTSTQFTVGCIVGSPDSESTNDSGYTYVAYLFATCAGVSKVGSYTGNGTTQTIDCGFTGGARFVLIKCTSTTGSWYVYDTARGMTTLTDPYLLLNSTSVGAATLGSVTTVSTGFALNSTILAAINTNAATYIFLAIA